MMETIGKLPLCCICKLTDNTTVKGRRQPTRQEAQDGPGRVKEQKHSASLLHFKYVLTLC